MNEKGGTQTDVQNFPDFSLWSPKCWERGGEGKSLLEYHPGKQRTPELPAPWAAAPYLVAGARRLSASRAPGDEVDAGRKGGREGDGLAPPRPAPGAALPLLRLGPPASARPPRFPPRLARPTPRGSPDPKGWSRRDSQARSTTGSAASRAGPKLRSGRSGQRAVVMGGRAAVGSRGPAGSERPSGSGQQVGSGQPGYYRLGSHSWTLRNCCAGKTRAPLSLHPASYHMGTESSDPVRALSSATCG
ncbi:uncharacterized protein LOC141547254 [Sminthopsis crassicaudata]|uniref:uncharacterized protein LOC141547254 n=1 Tax=Sminthopsis crassicaudata TaxID=9301 RepID=UPI003D68D0FB